MIKIFLYLLLSLLISCGSGGQFASDGEGSSTEVVIGLVTDNLGTPVENVIVNLYPSDYNPVTDSGVGKVMDSTDEDGIYEFEIVEPNSYNIVCERVCSNNSRRGAVTTYSSSEVDTTYDTLKLMPMVEKVVAVSASDLDTVGGFVYIEGTDYLVPISDAVETDGFYNFTFTAVPQGDEVAEVSYSSTDEPEEEVVVEEVEAEEPVEEEPVIEEDPEEEPVVEEDPSSDTTWYRVYSEGVDPLVEVYSVVQDSSGAMWFGNGSALLKVENGNWTQFDTSSGELNGSVSDIEADLNGGIWVTSGSNGLSYFDGANWTIYDSLDFSAIAGANCVVSISADTTWFGSTSGGDRGVFSYVKSSDSWSSVYLPGAGSENVIFDLESRGDEVWAAIVGGSSRYSNGVWTNFGRSEMGMDDGYPRNVDIMPDGGVWFSGSTGASYYDGDNWTFYDTTNSGLHAQDLYEITLDKDGRVYFGTSQGLTSYSDGEWKEHGSDAGTPPSVDDVIVAVTVDREGNVWAVGNGVYVMGPTAEKYAN
jgi:hypothetical protein